MKKKLLKEAEKKESVERKLTQIRKGKKIPRICLKMNKKHKMKNEKELIIKYYFVLLFLIQILAHKCYT